MKRWVSARIFSFLLLFAFILVDMAIGIASNDAQPHSLPKVKRALPLRHRLFARDDEYVSYYTGTYAYTYGTGGVDAANGKQVVQTHGDGRVGSVCKSSWDCLAMLACNVHQVCDMAAHVPLRPGDTCPPLNPEQPMPLDVVLVCDKKTKVFVVQGNHSTNASNVTGNHTTHKAKHPKAGSPCPKASVLPAGLACDNGTVVCSSDKGCGAGKKCVAGECV